MIDVDLRRYGTDKEYEKFVNGLLSGADFGETPIVIPLTKEGLEERTTEVQQLSVIQEVRQKAWEAAYNSYETRLKADMVAMLTDIQLEIEEMTPTYHNPDWSITDLASISEVNKIIQQKIDALKEESEEAND